ncbi:MAG: TerC family protein [Desulfitobacterium hafniense]|nr:TerC family protein [Desulfitobacterium hafniense]
MDAELFSGILSIIVINLVLSGDNAVVIAMAAQGLSETYRKKAIFWGATLAVILRIGLTFVAAMLMQIPMVQFIGGLLLAIIAVKLLYPKEEHTTGQAKGGDFKKALLTILWADLIMSLDNVLAVAGAAQGNMLLLVFGIAFSIPIVLAGSTLLTKLMDKYSWIAYVGAGVLAYTAGEMIIKDKLVADYIHSLPVLEYGIPVGLIILTILLGKRARAQKTPPKSIAQ